MFPEVEHIGNGFFVVPAVAVASVAVNPAVGSPAPDTPGLDSASFFTPTLPRKEGANAAEPSLAPSPAPAAGTAGTAAEAPAALPPAGDPAGAVRYAAPSASTRPRVACRSSRALRLATSASTLGPSPDRAHAAASSSKL